MDKYKAYVVEDFVLDADFQNWVRYPTAEKDGIWANYKAANPDQADDIQRARLLLGSVYARFEADISDEEIEEEISAMVMKIRQGQQEAASIDPGQLSTVRPFVKWLAAASVILVVSWLGWQFLKDTSPGNIQGIMENSRSKMIVRQNATTANQTLLLEDGTTVELGPDSELRTPEAFGEATREVYLTGEAFFKVSRDVKRPFLVYSENLITRVLGTSFIIRAIKSKPEEVVEVKEGKVSVFKKEDFRKAATNGESHGLLVTSNQKVTLEIRDSRLVKTLSDAPEVVPGKSGLIRSGYVNTPVSQVLKELKEAYQIDIVFDEELLSGCPLTAVLTDQSLKEKLEIICEAIEAKYEILDGQVMIYGKSCNE